MEWAKAPEVRDQMVLFPQRLDDVISLDHHVRLMDDILSRLDWSKWEAAYDLRHIRADGDALARQPGWMTLLTV